MNENKRDPKKNVMENIMDGLGDIRDLLQKFEEVSAKFAEPMSDDEMNTLINETVGYLREEVDKNKEINKDLTSKLSGNILELMECKSIV